MKRHGGQLIALLCGLALWAGCIWYQSPAQGAGAREWIRILSNGALIPGVLFLGVSGLTWIAGDGQFDGIRYSMSSLLARLRGEKKPYATYFDYTRREKKRGGYPLLAPGAFFLAAAVVLTLLYHLQG